MRVITGKARGRKLETLSGEKVRPTTDRIKEAIFSILQFDIEGRRFLDLFSGSGQMGIEALSRGAKEAVFVDSSKNSIAVIKRNLQSTALQENAKILNIDSLSFLAMKNGQFDIAYLDPPYGTGLLQEALPLVAQIMRKSGVIICESPINEKILSNYGEFLLDREYRYGKIKIYTFRHKDLLEG